MRRDSRLSVVLHALLHLAEAERAMTSEELAARMETHPVVMRRTLGGLREAGILRSEKGHGGGWTLARELESLTLGDVYDALGIATVFAVGARTESPGCPLEQAVNRATGEAFNAAESLLLERLHRVKLADLAADVKRRHGAIGRAHAKRQRTVGCPSPKKKGKHAHA